jgi:transcriptional regulator GlxA family with amidase domain
LTRSVGILVFDDVEELDFVGPFEVFAMASKLRSGTFEVFTVGVERAEFRGFNGLRVRADCTMERAPKIDVLVVPGGRGARRLMSNQAALDFVRRAYRTCELVTSVCTGALVLASAGLLDGRRATTHWGNLEELRKFKLVRVDHKRYIKQGKVITSAGVSSGINMALYVVGLLYGAKLKTQTAKQVEFALG